VAKKHVSIQPEAAISPNRVSDAASDIPPTFENGSSPLAVSHQDSLEVCLAQILLIRPGLCNESIDHSLRFCRVEIDINWG
jgi:hypothetical protein